MLQTDRSNTSNNQNLGMYDNHNNKPTLDGSGGGGGGGIIIAGGHINHRVSHEEEIVRSNNNNHEGGGDDKDDNRLVRIIKTGDQAKVAALIDLEFDVAGAGGGGGGAEGPDQEQIQQQQQQQQHPNNAVKLVRVSTDYIDLEDSCEDSVIVKSIIEKRMRVVKDLEQEVIVDYSHRASGDDKEDNFVLSSDRTRFPIKTSVGTLFCDMIKEELQVDVALLNRSVPQGDKTYPDGKMTYADLKLELPTPSLSSPSMSSATTTTTETSTTTTTTTACCRIVEVPMTRLQLYKAITYSRMNAKQERDGYLQTDSMYDDSSYPAELAEETIQVALPLNLLLLPLDHDDDDDKQEDTAANESNVGKILPLIELSKSLREQKLFPDLEDDAIPALDIVTRHCCKNRWVDIIRNTSSSTVGSERDHAGGGGEEGGGDSTSSSSSSSSTMIAFGDIDLNDDGVLDKHEIKILLQGVLGYEPDDQVVEDMISSIDVDGNGVIDEDEFGYVLARIERECSK